MNAALDFQEHQVRGVELHSSGQTGAGAVATGGSNATFLQGLLSGERGLNWDRFMNHFIS